MVVKAIVSAEEKARIEELASLAGMSVSSYLKKQALCWTDTDPSPLIELIETQTPFTSRVYELATTIIRNKVIYEAEILELLEHTCRIENMTSAALKEVLRNGHSG